MAEQANNNTSSIAADIPESLLKKLNYFAKENLAKDELAVLNTVFGVYRYSMENRCTVFKDHPEFQADISRAAGQAVEELAITPTITLTTTVTITTTIASHPIITCTAAIVDGDC